MGGRKSNRAGNRADVNRLSAGPNDVAGPYLGECGTRNRDAVSRRCGEEGGGRGVDLVHAVGAIMRFGAPLAADRPYTRLALF